MEQNTKRLPTHPGDLLKEELEVRGISQKQFRKKDMEKKEKQSL